MYLNYEFNKYIPMCNREKEREKEREREREKRKRETQREIDTQIIKKGTVNIIFNNTV